MPNPVKWKVKYGTIPDGFKGTINELLQKITEEAFVEPDVEYAEIYVGLTEPTSNIGLWLKPVYDAGTIISYELFVWSDSEGKYISIFENITDDSISDIANRVAEYLRQNDGSITFINKNYLSQNYYNPGTFTYTVPESVTEILVEGWGPGGSGAGGDSDNNHGGCGGGGGGYFRALLQVTAGQAFEVVVGAGKPGGAPNANGQDSENTTFGGTLLVANGGDRGTQIAKGAGGTWTYDSTSSIIKTIGGADGSDGTLYSGNQGGSGGQGGGFGGPGGVHQAAANATAGRSPGGGGGGGRDNPTFGGGAGGNGFVRISY